MRKVIFGINITADGYCSHEDGIADAELHNYFTELLRKTDVILYGRKTYQLMVPYWPDLAKNPSEDEASNEFARVFDSLDLLVFSKTLQEVSGNKPGSRPPSGPVRLARQHPRTEEHYRVCRFHV